MMIKSEAFFVSKLYCNVYYLECQWVFKVLKTKYCINQTKMNFPRKRNCSTISFDLIPVPH